MPLPRRIGTDFRTLPSVATALASCHRSLIDRRHDCRSCQRSSTGRISRIWAERVLRTVGFNELRMEAFGEGLVERREQVPVTVEGHRDRGMSEPLLDRFWVRAL